MGTLEWDWDHTEHLGTSSLPPRDVAPHVPSLSPVGEDVRAGRFALAIVTMGVEELGGGDSRHGDEGDHATLSVFGGGTGADNHRSPTYTECQETRVHSSLQGTQQWHSRIGSLYLFSRHN